MSDTYVDVADRRHHEYGQEISEITFFFAVAMTSQPANESELQLYRVLQRANLLSYYDTFICQGKHAYIYCMAYLIKRSANEHI